MQINHPTIKIMCRASAVDYINAYFSSLLCMKHRLTREQLNEAQDIKYDLFERASREFGDDSTRKAG